MSIDFEVNLQDCGDVFNCGSRVDALQGFLRLVGRQENLGCCQLDRWYGIASYKGFELIDSRRLDAITSSTLELCLETQSFKTCADSNKSSGEYDMILQYIVSNIAVRRIVMIMR